MGKINKSSEDVNQIEIEYYTDPLCCWSWAFELHWRRFITENTSLIKWKYRMCGLLPDWSTYNDPFNKVSHPAHIGSIWAHAKQVTGVLNDERIWSIDPPSSSYPACIAVKCAEIQSTMASDLYLQRLRQAVMLHRKNIAKRNALLNIASQLEIDHPLIFNANKFEKDLDGNAGILAFREDLLKTKYHNIKRFPAITMKKPGKKSIFIVGYRPYEVLMEALNQLTEVSASHENY